MRHRSSAVLGSGGQNRYSPFEEESMGGWSAVSRPAGLALVLVATTALASALEQPDPLRQPLSPGSVALLLAGRMGPAEVARCREALAHPRPETRAAAARVARVSGAPGLVPALLQALATEKDLPAAREELMALGWLTAGSADDAMFAAAKRLGGAIDRALATSVALRGPQALPLLPRLNGLQLEEWDWREFFTWATREGQESAPEAAAAAVALGNPAAWTAILSVRSPLVIDASVLARAIASQSVRVRESTYWHLLRSRHQGTALDPSTEAALAAAPEAVAETAPDAVAVFAFELLQRGLGRKAVDRTALLQGLPEAERARLQTDAAVLAQLREPERAVYARLLFRDRATLDESLKTYGRAQDAGRAALAAAAKPGRTPVAPPTRVRTASDFTPGLMADLLSVTGCRLPDQPSWAMLEIRHDEKGALAAAGLGPLQDLGSCEAAARALLLMAAVPHGRPARPKETDVLVLPVYADFASCAPRAEPTPPLAIGGATRVGGVLREPSKTRSVSPRYPSSAVAERRQGAVVLEATVGPEGGVCAAEVLYGEHPDLQGEALRAVMQWRYTPTLLNGKPVPVIMTVTVNFRL
jgi:TonB family protein